MKSILILNLFLSINIVTIFAVHAENLDLRFENVRQPDYQSIIPKQRGFIPQIVKYYDNNTTWRTVNYNMSNTLNDINVSTELCGECLHLKFDSNNVVSYSNNGVGYSDIMKYNYYTLGNDYKKELEYVITGDLDFFYYPDATNYHCESIAIGGYYDDKSKKTLPEMFSNLAYDNNISYSKGRNDEIFLLCSIVSNEDIADPSVFKINRSISQNTFTIAKIESLNVLTHFGAGLLVADYFNRLPITQQELAFSRSSSDNNHRLLIKPLTNLSVNDNDEIANLESLEISTDPQDAITMQTSVQNLMSSPVTLTTNSISKQTSTSVSTTNTNTLGGEIGMTAKWTEGNGFFMSAAQDFSFTVNYSHTWATNITSISSTTFTLPQQQILVEPHCEYDVKASIGVAKVKTGTFKFHLPIELQTMDNMHFCSIQNSSGVCTDLRGRLNLPAALKDANTRSLYESGGTAYLSGSGKINEGSTGDSYSGKVIITARSISGQPPCSVHNNTILIDKNHPINYFKPTTLY